MSSDGAIDLDRGLPVTHADVEALRRARGLPTPSWLALSWPEIVRLLPPDLRRTRPIANDGWEPFSLP